MVARQPAIFGGSKSGAPANWVHMLLLFSTSIYNSVHIHTQKNAGDSGLNFKMTRMFWMCQVTARGSLFCCLWLASFTGEGINHGGGVTRSFGNFEVCKQPFLFSFKNVIQGWGDGSYGKVLAIHLWRPEFSPQKHIQRWDMVHTCIPSTGER